MSGMSNAQARIVDPVLSTHARGYTNAEFVGTFLFPIVPVFKRGGRRIEFNKESFRLYNTKRAPGTDSDEVQFGYLGKPFAVEQDALDGKVPLETMQEANDVPGIDMGKMAVNEVQRILRLGLEYEQAQLARDANTYAAESKITLAGAALWSDPGSDPYSDISLGKEVIRSKTGRYPNTLVLPPVGFEALKKHPTIKDNFKYTSSASITAEMLANYFEVDRVVVGKAVYSASAADDLADVWGNDAILAWVPVADQSWGVPSYGYTYQLNGYPIVEQPWYARKKKSWMYPLTNESTPELVGADAGYLLQNVAALPV